MHERRGIDAKSPGPVADADHQRVVLLDDLEKVRLLERRRFHQRRQQADQHQLRVQHRLDLAKADTLVIEQPADAVHRLLVELDWREHEVGRRERSDHADVGIRIGVDHAHVACCHGHFVTHPHEIAKHYVCAACASACACRQG